MAFDGCVEPLMEKGILTGLAITEYSQVEANNTEIITVYGSHA